MLIYKMILKKKIIIVKTQHVQNHTGFSYNRINQLFYSVKFCQGGADIKSNYGNQTLSFRLYSEVLNSNYILQVRIFFSNNKTHGERKYTELFLKKEKETEKENINLIDFSNFIFIYIDIN